MKHLIPILLAAACGLGAGPARAAEAGESLEGQLKAVHLFNFTKFVEWPEAAFAGPASPIAIGVLGESPFGPALDQAVQGETVKGRGLEIRRSKNAEDLRACHVVFVGKSEKAQLPKILAALADTHALVVGESEGCAERGCVANFGMKANKIIIEINVAEARKRHLKISSQLLGIAKIIGKSE